jgi:hypothetical protein
LELLVDRATFIISRMVAATEDTSEIFGLILSVTQLDGVVTGTFDASLFEMPIIFGVSVALAVGTLDYFPFVFRRFEFDFALLQMFNEKYVPVIWGRFEFHKNMHKGSLVQFCVIFQMLVTWCPRFSISVFILAGPKV